MNSSERSCIYVSDREHIYVRVKFHQIFVRVTYGRGSVLLVAALQYTVYLRFLEAL